MLKSMLLVTAISTGFLPGCAPVLAGVAVGGVVGGGTAVALHWSDDSDTKVLKAILGGALLGVITSLVIYGVVDCGVEHDEYCSLNSR